MQPDNQNGQGQFNSIQPYSVSDVPPLQSQSYAPIEDYDQDYKESKGGFFDRFGGNRIFIFVIIGFVALGLLIFGILLFQASSQPSTPPVNIDNNNNGGTDGGNGGTDTTYIQMWGMFIDEDSMQPLIDEYEADNPGITIDYANKRNTAASDVALESYRSELNRVINSNDTAQQPDIFMVDNSWAADYEDYVRVSTTYDSSKFAQTFYPAATTDFVSNNSVYGVPLWMDSYAVVYNKTILSTEGFNAPPDGWSEFKNLAETLTDSDSAGFAAGLSSNSDFQDGLFWTLILQYGAEVMDANGNFAFGANPDSADALEFLQSFVDDKIWAADNENASAAFLKGEVAMIVVPSWRLRDIIYYNDTLNLGIDIGVAQMPQVPGQSAPLIAWADYWGAMVNNSRPNSTAAWAFLDWLTEPAQLRKLSQNIQADGGYFGIVYPRQDMANDLAGNEYLDVYNDSAAVAQSARFVKGIEARAEINDLIDSGSATTSRLTQSQSALQELVLLKGQLE